MFDSTTLVDLNAIGKDADSDLVAKAIADYELRSQVSPDWGKSAPSWNCVEPDFGFSKEQLIWVRARDLRKLCRKSSERHAINFGNCIRCSRRSWDHRQETPNLIIPALENATIKTNNRERKFLAEWIPRGRFEGKNSSKYGMAREKRKTERKMQWKNTKFPQMFFGDILRIFPFLFFCSENGKTMQTLVVNKPDQDCVVHLVKLGLFVTMSLVHNDETLCVYVCFLFWCVDKP